MNKSLNHIKLKAILNSENVVNSIRQNLETLLKIIPQLKPLIGFNQKHPHHHLDAWEHTLLALSMAKNDFDVRIALLLHDIGKPHCFTDGEDGVRHFKGHAEKSAEISAEILQMQLGYEKSYSDFLCKIIELHDTPLTEQFILNNLEFSEKLFFVQICDVLAHNPEKNAKRIAYIEKTAKIFKEFNKNIEFQI